MKYLILLFFPCYLLSQSKLPQDNPKKLSGTIDHQYTNYSSPIGIQYKIYPYGGSKEYLFSWRTGGADWSDFSKKDTYTLTFDCDKNKIPECIIYCKIKDVVTGKYILIEKRHAIESCTNKKNN